MSALQNLILAAARIKTEAALARDRSRHDPQLHQHLDWLHRRLVEHGDPESLASPREVDRFLDSVELLVHADEQHRLGIVAGMNAKVPPHSRYIGCSPATRGEPIHLAPPTGLLSRESLSEARAAVAKAIHSNK